MLVVPSQRGGRNLYIYQGDTSTLAPWIQREIHLDEAIEAGDRGQGVRRVQEWLTLRGYPLAIDGNFSIATAETVAQFQEDALLSATGRVDPETFARLTEPMLDVLKQQLDISEDWGSAILAYARAHLRSHPREIGGQNRGPWVRLYMRGGEGTDRPWCAGFVSFLLHQASESLNVEVPVSGWSSCDYLAAQAQRHGFFVSEIAARGILLPPGSIFVSRASDTDWDHTGVIVDSDPLTLTTIEGNTNDEGSREGYEVAMRTRSYSNRDFIVFDH
jgi:hypothetical protein